MFDRLWGRYRFVLLSSTVVLNSWDGNVSTHSRVSEYRSMIFGLERPDEGGLLPHYTKYSSLAVEIGLASVNGLDVF